MSDEPNVPGDDKEVHESSIADRAEFMVQSLQNQVTDARNAAEDAKTEAGNARVAAASAQEQVAKWKKLTRVLILVVVLSLLASGVAGYGWYQSHTALNGLREQSIAGCEAGNVIRANEVKVWDSVLNAFLVGKPTQATIDFVKQKEAFIADQLAPRNCQQAFQNIGHGAAPTSGTPKADNVAVTWTAVQVQNWGGLCLTIANANVGTRVTEGDCAHSHTWELGSNGILYPQGHPNVQVGDSGGYLTLKSPGTAVSSDNAKVGPQGFDYDRMGFLNPTSYYWHANGNGQDITCITNPGSSLAVYYAFLDGGLNNSSVPASGTV